MCDALVTDRTSNWPRDYECDRKGKYERIVDVVTYGSSESRARIVIYLCGQHRNILEKGDTLRVRHYAKEYTVRGQMTEIGELRQELDNVKRQISQSNWALGVRKETLGLTVASMADQLIDALDGSSSPEINHLVEHLIELQNMRQNNRELVAKADEIQAKIEEKKKESK